jgi:mannosyltransferase OCH1-like enzyme
MIPKIFHQIWLGPQPIHPQMQEWIVRWRELHPNWAHKLWRDVSPTIIEADGEKIESRWSDLLQRACHFSQRSNIWRYELVLQQGGVYLDTDMEPRANIDSAIEGYDAFAASHWPTGAASCAFFGARAGHDWILDMVQSLNTRDPTKSLSMGNYFFQEVQRRHAAAVPCMPRDVFLFYPHRSFAIHDQIATANTLAIHRWSCFWSPTGYTPL